MAHSSFYSESPVMTLAAQYPPDQYFQQSHYQKVSTVKNIGIPTPGIPTPSEAFNRMSVASQPPTPSEGAIAGRKRSRSDIFEDDDDHLDGSTTHTQPAQLPTPNQVEPSYGPGMTLTYPNDRIGHHALDAGSQTGTWVENTWQSNPTAECSTTQSKRPIIASRKSQRRDTNAPASEDMTTNQVAVPRAPGTEPLIDEATRLLGISWTRMDSNEALQIGKRAYTRWIQKHYPFLTNVEVWFENSAIPGYLGLATNTSNGTQEYYLWSYDLHQAILVTRQPNDLILKLSQPHMSLSQATETIYADLQPVVEAKAANAAILMHDRFMIEDEAPAGEMDID